jgi:AcrR family transcriptional regulator
MTSENKKRAEIRNAARNLFWKHGMKRVTVEDICLEAGVSKMTFYKHFNNKRELALHVIRHLFDESLNEYRQVMDGPQTYPEKVRILISNKLRIARDASQELITEMYRLGEPEIMAYIQEMSLNSMSMMREEFRDRQAKGEIRSDVNLEFLLYFLNKMIEMVGDPEFNKIFSTAEEMTATLSNFFFYGIMPHPELRNP